MMIKANKCLELGLPTPYSFETNASYTYRLMVEGYQINTRQALYIKLNNLHSIKSSLLNKKGIQFESKLACAYCPDLDCVPKEPVIHMFMTQEQREYELSKNMKPVGKLT